MVDALPARFKEVIGPACMWEGGEKVVKATIIEEMVEIDSLDRDESLISLAAQKSFPPSATVLGGSSTRFTFGWKGRVVSRIVYDA